MNGSNFYSGSDDIVLECECDATDSLNIVLIKAICALENIDPMEAPDELGYRLHDYVNSEGLELLVDHGDTSGAVEINFELDNYHVQLFDTGKLIIREPG